MSSVQCVEQCDNVTKRRGRDWARAGAMEDVATRFQITYSHLQNGTAVADR